MRDRSVDGEDPDSVERERSRPLPDVVALGLRLLLVGLNPSPASAASGVAFARPGNRFWPAALAAKIVSRDRDPTHALVHHGVGFTDLVARVTARADELAADEYVQGAQRLRVLVKQIQPAVVCFVGLTGYRVAVDKRAAVGWQTERFGDQDTYVMPNPSGLNAHTNVGDLAQHLRAAAAGATRHLD